MRRWFLCILSLFLLHIGFSQNKAIVSFKQDTALMGTNVPLYIDLFVPQDVSLSSFDLSIFKSAQLVTDTIIPDAPAADINITDYGSWQDVNGNEVLEPQELLWKAKGSGRGLVFQNQLQIKFWEPGVFQMPDIHFPLTNGDTLIAKGDRITIGVEALSEPLDSLGLAPIKPIIPEDLLWKDYFKSILPILIVLLALLLVWVIIRTGLFRKKEKAAEIPEIIIRPAHEIALERLTDLENQQLWQKGEIKRFQTEITHIIREYLENRYGILALESSTSEIIHQLKPLGFNMELKQKLQDILLMADLVKFAKAKPPENIHQQFMDYAVSFVKTTKQTELSEESNEEEE
jgi:hypothetical protein